MLFQSIPYYSKPSWVQTKQYVHLRLKGERGRTWAEKFCLIVCILIHFNITQRVKEQTQGPVCVSFSMIGKREQERSTAFATHEAYFEKIAPANDLIIVENVPEYKESLVLSILNRGNAKEWACHSIRLDPRFLGMGVARARVFMVIFKTDKLKWCNDISLESLATCLASKNIMTADSYFWEKLPRTVLTDAEEL